MSARTNLLIQAEKVFNAFGYRRTSMGEVAKVAGVSRQGLYHHFPNKPALFVAVMTRGHTETVNQSIEARDAARARGADFEAIVTAMLDARFGTMLRWMRTTPHWGEIFEEVTRRCAQVVLEQTLRFNRLLTELVQNEIESGRLELAEGVTPEELAAAFSTAARGVNLNYPPPDTATVHVEYERHVRLLMCGANRKRVKTVRLSAVLPQNTVRA
ncbi:MAG TPA: helix-turn-helix domain-containing protein [Rhizomicrobium sp.]|nr:helix-turn-helix domain-containing protein [Rhizomicrobium sp.]